jgi:hypothetical protein
VSSVFLASKQTPDQDQKVVKGGCDGAAQCRAFACCHWKLTVCLVDACSLPQGSPASKALAQHHQGGHSPSPAEGARVSDPSMPCKAAQHVRPCPFLTSVAGCCQHTSQQTLPPILAQKHNSTQENHRGSIGLPLHNRAHCRPIVLPKLILSCTAVLQGAGSGGPVRHSR